MREFHIGDILSITTGALVSRDGIDGVYEILNYVTNDTLFTHQLVRAANEVAPYLQQCFPDLASIEVPNFSEATDAKEAVLSWLDSMVELYGGTRLVEPMREADHARIDPLSEILMIVSQRET